MENIIVKEAGSIKELMFREFVALVIFIDWYFQNEEKA